MNLREIIWSCIGASLSGALLGTLENFSRKFFGNASNTDRITLSVYIAVGVVMGFTIMIVNIIRKRKKNNNTISHDDSPAKNMNAEGVFRSIVSGFFFGFAICAIADFSRKFSEDGQSATNRVSLVLSIGLGAIIGVIIGVWRIATKNTIKDDDSSDATSL
ncbi:MAG: hypothetical protein LBQ03_01165 [Puniceicoccales bacterium]|jgi:membrane protein DedA with SNARE-associated domain|nr:hypothetical protein [Puniceicoccales bacterium]